MNAARHRREGKMCSFGKGLSFRFVEVKACSDSEYHCSNSSEDTEVTVMRFDRMKRAGKPSEMYMSWLKRSL